MPLVITDKNFNGTLIDAYENRFEQVQDVGCWYDSLDEAKSVVAAVTFRLGSVRLPAVSGSTSFVLC